MSVLHKKVHMMCTQN